MTLLINNEKKIYLKPESQPNHDRPDKHKNISIFFLKKPSLLVFYKLKSPTLNNDAELAPQDGLSAVKSRYLPRE